MYELATIETRLPILGIDDWDEIRKAEATLDAYLKYARQDSYLRDKALEIAAAIVRLKWHKGRILAEMDKNPGGNPQLVTVCHRLATYDELGIHKKEASREQLVRKAFDEQEIIETCHELKMANKMPSFSYFLRLANRRSAVKPPPIQGKYRVWYADPPWQYGSNFENADDTFQKRWTAAETHYGTLSLDELCGMGNEIKEACEDDAVLFMWVTSPLLFEALPVINAWGFKYKASFVWDKIRQNFGHYNSVRHEFLLVCTKGSCLPESHELLDSVVSLEKTAKHSGKPDYFREMIDRLYPTGGRIEVFARQETEGWIAWGDEIAITSGDHEVA